MNYRNFHPEREELARQWASLAVSKDRWKNKGQFSSLYGTNETESKPFVVEREDGLLGLAKPGGPKGPEDAHAAHEKIASDLAYHLGLPIAPAILCDSGKDFPVPNICIASWAFPSCDTWARLSGHLTDVEKQSCGHVFSAMAVFETWISAEDRNKGDAVLIDSHSKNPIALAFYDYAFSLSRQWKTTNDGIGKADSFFPPPIVWQEAAGKDIADKIASFDEAIVEDIISRIPVAYLLNLKKDNIIGNLKGRSRVIHAHMGL